MSILDLGCGLGKQTLFLAERLSPDTRILSIDLSGDAVDHVNTTAQRRALHNVGARRIGLDDCVAVFTGQKFDLILSTYAIYYASDMPWLLRSLVTLLHPGGTIFVCGNGAGSNRELYGIANR